LIRSRSFKKGTSGNPSGRPPGIVNQAKLKTPICSWCCAIRSRNCTHGEWGELTGRDGGKRLLPFSDRTVRAYMTIAKNPAFSNGQHVAHLPASWGTLAEIHAAPDWLWTALVARMIEGEWTVDTTRQMDFLRLFCGTLTGHCGPLRGKFPPHTTIPTLA
jgi:hypothetical protein